MLVVFKNNEARGITSTLIKLSIPPTVVMERKEEIEKFFNAPGVPYRYTIQLTHESIRVREGVDAYGFWEYVLVGIEKREAEFLLP